MNAPQSLRKEYEKYGYVHLKEVLSTKDVEVLKNLILESGRRSYVREIDFLLKHHDLYKHQFNPSIISAVKQIFGVNSMYVNDVNIQVEQFYNDRPDKGWHADADGEGMAKYLFRREYGLAKIGIYLKSNSAEMGGGVDVEVGGHRSYQYFGDSFIGHFFSVIYYKIDRLLLSKFRRREMINTKAGDVLIFDSRLPHRSSPKFVSESDEDERKISIYWQVAKNANNANDYLRHSMRMDFVDENNFRHYGKFLSLSFPADYPVDYVNYASDYLPIASLSNSLSDRYKKDLPSGNYEEVFFNQK